MEVSEPSAEVTLNVDPRSVRFQVPPSDATRASKKVLRSPGVSRLSHPPERV
jgi:hypothetical protein